MEQITEASAAGRVLPEPPLAAGAKLYLDLLYSLEGLDKLNSLHGTSPLWKGETAHPLAHTRNRQLRESLSASTPLEGVG